MWLDLLQQCNKGGPVGAPQKPKIKLVSSIYCIYLVYISQLDHYGVNEIKSYAI